MHARIPALAALAVLSSVGMAPAASAQTKPMHSGHLSHGAPQMKVHGSGLHRPNRPQYHHHYGFDGYRPVYQPYAPISKQASEQGLVF